MNARELAEFLRDDDHEVAQVIGAAGVETILRALRLLTAAEANDGTGCKLVEDLRTEADLCRNETATDIADLLDDAASSIIAISAQFNAIKDERNGLAARVEELEPDAERYRWLVNTDHWSYTPPPMRAVRASWLCSLAKMELDAAIDAARGSKP